MITKLIRNKLECFIFRLYKEEPKPCSAPCYLNAAPLLEAGPLLDFEEVELTFQETLLKHIDRRELNDVDVYKKAFIDRRHFSKIRSNKDYAPSKDTVIKLIFALELGTRNAKDLLEKAGYALSRSSKRDLIFDFCIRKHIYDLMDINQLLLEYEQPLLEL